MANEPRQTEIDDADDLFLGDDDEEEESGEPAGAEPGETEQDQAPFEPSESSVEEEEEEPPPEADEDYWEDEDEAPAKKRKKRVPVLQYYAIPAVGVILIMALGWTFTFIARRGLIPTEEPAKTAKVEKNEDKVLPEKEPPPKNPNEISER